MHNKLCRDLRCRAAASKKAVPIRQKEVVIIVTLKDVAKTCGVSAATVSRAFDPSSRISQPVRQKVLQCASELGYTPNLIARSLKNSRTMTVALIVPSIENRFYIDVLQRLELTLHRYGYRLLVTFVHEGVSTERDCLEMAAAAQVDGIIVLPQSDANRRYIDFLAQNRRIIQLFNNPFSHIDSVVMDDEKGAELGTKYLLSHGHRRILCVGGEDRIAGFWRAVDRAQVPRDSVLTLPGTTTVEDLCTAIHSFGPTALFSIAFANEITWAAVQRLDLSIPSDISMLVYDDTQWVSMVGLTVIAHDLEEITSALVAQLIHRLNGNTDSPVKQLVLDPFLIERKSVRTLDTP